MSRDRFLLRAELAFLDEAVHDAESVRHHTTIGFVRLWLLLFRVI
jgi:hypothetical protein